ncbi:hypothetical protein HHI36_001259 [Cryptolaemus montrouzieri]|uniref:Uncharacterized protein n=1 Tax=Cryptolaemus montrouzieri TaxID=559131 RepID=A0ABD2P7V3_9CUCU
MKSAMPYGATMARLMPNPIYRQDYQLRNNERLSPNHRPLPAKTNKTTAIEYYPTIVPCRQLVRGTIVILFAGVAANLDIYEVSSRNVLCSRCGKERCPDWASENRSSIGIL